MSETIDPSDAQRPPQSTYIRPATLSDSPCLSRICLLTAEAGQSAEHLHTFGDLPGLIYAEPYVHLPSAGGFVMVDPTKKGLNHSDGKGAVVGYILSAFDTTSFERELEETWFPQWRSKYPNPVHHHQAEGAPTSSESETSQTAENPGLLRTGSSQHDVGGLASLPDPLPADNRYITIIHNPHHASPSSLAFSPAHLHIDILPEYQRQGWGRKLIGKLIAWLKEEKGMTSVWLGMDPRNREAAKFYERLGFKPVDGAPQGVVGLRFDEWKY